MYLYIWIGRYTSGAACSAHTCRGHKIALPQSSSFRRCVVLSCVSSCEQEACTNKETYVRLRNLRALHPSISGAAVDHTWLHTPMRWEKQHVRAILKTRHIAIAIGV